MKKTLVALAALAATSAFAQNVSITGEYAYAYRATTVQGGSDSSGFGVDTTAINFNVNEDLGGGLKAAAVFGFDGANRNNAASGATGGYGVFGADSSIALSGAFGKLTGASGQGSDYVSGDWISLDAKLYGAKTTSDSVSYTLPAFGPVTVSLTHAESDNAASVGEGNGATGSQAQRNNTLTVAYASGALTATGGLRAYDQNSGDTASKTRVRGKVAYDFGVAKVGGAFLQTQYGQGTNTQTLLAVSAPFGNLTLTGEVAANTDSGRNSGTSTVADGTGHAYALSAVYSLSKRTSLQAVYKNWQQSNTSGYTSTETTLLLDHTF